MGKMVITEQKQGQFKPTLIDLPEDARRKLRRAIFEYLNKDDFKPSMNMSRDPRFAEFGSRALSEQFQALHMSGALEKRGERSDAAYQITPEGLAMKRLLGRK